MDNVLYIYRKGSVNMLTGIEHPYPAPISVVTEYLISDEDPWLQARAIICVFR